MNIFEINSTRIPYKKQYVQIVFDLNDAGGTEISLGDKVSLDEENYNVVGFDVSEKEFASVTLELIEERYQFTYEGRTWEAPFDLEWWRETEQPIACELTTGETHFIRPSDWKGRPAIPTSFYRVAVNHGGRKAKLIG